MSRLDEILDKVYDGAKQDPLTEAYGAIIDLAKADIQKLFLEVVGEDEKLNLEEVDYHTAPRNQLRAELRKKIKEAL